MEQLIARAAEVKKYRDWLVVAKGILGDMQQVFNAEHAGQIENIKKYSDVLQGAESDLRKATVEAYLADPTHNKQVLPGVVGIRDNTVVDYDPEKALAWAKEHGMALLLDADTYELLVKAGHAPGTMRVEPMATIAREIKLPPVVTP